MKQAVKTTLRWDGSQSGENRLLKRLVARHACEPFILDVGANDGVTMSNSLPFVRAGWRAVLAEPAPAVFARLKANHGWRATATLLQVACSDRSGEADLHFGVDGEGGMLATLCQDQNEWFAKTRTGRSTRVRVDTITHILESANAPARPGILLVDCEGMDYEALCGLNFHRYRPTVIVTEEYEWEPPKHAAKYSLLIHAGYSLVQKVGCNTFWLDRNAQRAI